MGADSAGAVSMQGAVSMRGKDCQCEGLKLKLGYEIMLYLISWEYSMYSVCGSRLAVSMQGLSVWSQGLSGTSACRAVSSLV